MASTELLQYVIVLIILWEIICKCTAHIVPTEQVSTEQLPTQQSPCMYPQGSIPCKVWNHTKLDCSFRKLDCIPPLPHATSLKVLDLSINKINHIPDGAFSNLYELQNLLLNINKIHLIPDYAFSKLCKLQNLDLSWNDIFVLQQKLFSGLQELQSLHLSHNSILNIQGDAFSKLPKLLSLDLSYNSLSILCDNTFSKLRALQYLDLSSNNIVFDNNTLRGLKKLKHLNLSCFELDGSPFHDLILLQTLSITTIQNVIHLTNATFVGLKNLQELKAREIHWDTVTIPFAGLTSLCRFYTDIYIESLSDCAKVEKLFSGLDKLEYLHFHVNGQFCSNVDICLLASLNSLELTNCNLNGTSKCLEKIPLRTLNFFPRWEANLSAIRYASTSHKPVYIHLSRCTRCHESLTVPKFTT